MNLIMTNYYIDRELHSVVGLYLHCESLRYEAIIGPSMRTSSPLGFNWV